MTTLAEIILVFVLLTNFALLGSGRLSMCIKQVAAQGVVLGLLPLLVAPAIISVGAAPVSDSPVLKSVFVA